MTKKLGWCLTRGTCHKCPGRLDSGHECSCKCHSEGST